MATRDLSSIGSSMSAKFADGRAREFAWGCELTKDKPEVKWSWEEEDEDREYLEHTLFLRHALLGVDANIDERHVIEVETKDYQGKEIKQPIISIGKGSHMLSIDLNYSHEFPVTFRLIKGDGPVHLTAQQLVEFPDEGDMNYDTEADYTATETEDFDEDEDDEEEEEEEDDDEDDDEEEEKTKKPKGTKRKASLQAATKKKKGKLEVEDDEEDMDAEEDEDDDEEEESEEEQTPEKKKKGKAKKEAAKGKKGKETGKAKGKKEKAGKKKGK